MPYRIDKVLIPVVWFNTVMSAVRLGFKNEAKTNPKYNFEA